MDKEKLAEHIRSFLGKERAPDAGSSTTGSSEDRNAHIRIYQNWTQQRLVGLDRDTLFEYLSPLWALIMWGDKRKKTDQYVDDNGIESLRRHLSDLVWGKDSIEERWDRCRKELKGIGPGIMSELLCKTHPEQFAIWNSRTQTGLTNLGIPDIPRHSHQVSGANYRRICEISKEIRIALKEAGAEDSTLLTVDYFLWDELQDEPSEPSKPKPVPKAESAGKEFLHNDIRDKIRDIGQWLGFEASIERKIAAGSQVDAIWESTIGNLGRIIYVFEVQTKGSIDSLLINLQKSLNHPAVQGVVAVSDHEQIDKIRNHARALKDLRGMKFWNYEEVIKIHENLESVNSSINNLGLVPDTI
jgi:hypothetical protein